MVLSFHIPSILFLIEYNGDKAPPGIFEKL